MFFFMRRGGFGSVGPLGMAFAAYRFWRRLSPQQRQQAAGRVRNFSTRLRGGSSATSSTTNIQ
jgi:hypothetical protein